jgi:uncharacterized protein YbaR (Trm112 family)
MTSPVRVGVGGGDALARWRDVLACPACHSAIPDLEHCDVCGQVYPAEEGLPRLIPAGFSRPVQFTFESSRATAGAHELLEKLSIPQPSDRRNLPYHLDPCHAKVIEQVSAARYRMEEAAPGAAGAGT